MSNKTLKNPIGQILAQRRKDKNLTQEVVAETLELTVEAISRMERGTIMPSLKRLEQFADIYECRISDLLTQSSHRTNDQVSYLYDLLSPLTEEDRTLILSVVKSLAKRLKEDSKH